MSQSRGGSKLIWLVKWGALLGGFAIVYAMGQLMYLGMAATAGYVGWQMMKGAPFDRAAVMPAGLWGGIYGVDGAMSGGAGPIDIVSCVIGYAIVGIVLVWLIKFVIGKLFR